MQYSPREIVTGKVFDAAKHCRARFGAYVEASRDADVTNDMEPRTEPCIAVGPSGNRQGSVLCFKLGNAKVVTRRTVKVLPMPTRVVKLLNALGKASGKTSLKFLNRSREPFQWENDDLDESRLKKVLGKNKSRQASSPRTKSYADAVRAPSQGSRRGSRLPRQ